MSARSAAAGIDANVELNPSFFGWFDIPRRHEGRGVEENVIAAVVWQDEAESAIVKVSLDYAGLHYSNLFDIELGARRAGTSADPASLTSTTTKSPRSKRKMDGRACAQFCASSA
jgi:TPR repeat protein